MRIVIDTREVKKFATTLKKVNKSALPNAIRETVNKTALDVKQNTMPDIAGRAFKKRQPNFFKAMSKVQFAKGKEISSLKAIVGFTDKDLKGANNYAVKDLEEQEEGGTIGGKSLIPTKQARSGSSWDKKVRSNLRLSEIRRSKIINARLVKIRVKNSEHGKEGRANKAKVVARNRKQQFVRAAIISKQVNGDNAFVLGNRYRGMQTLSKITSITHDKHHRKIKIKRTPVYTYKPKRKISVARTNFMRRASMESGLKIDRIFVDEALKQLKRYMKQ